MIGQSIFSKRNHSIATVELRIRTYPYKRPESLCIKSVVSHKKTKMINRSNNIIAYPLAIAIKIVKRMQIERAKKKKKRKPPFLSAIIKLSFPFHLSLSFDIFKHSKRHTFILFHSFPQCMTFLSLFENLNPIYPAVFQVFTFLS